MEHSGKSSSLSLKYWLSFQVDDLRKLVKACGIDGQGSNMDLLLRLREEMKTRSTYDKVFEKVWGASGKFQEAAEQKVIFFVFHTYITICLAI